ncbi:hypothetical protein SAMN06296241_1368 [Salinimicrobium sediminis]|uniref:Uncharacterized protein n=1 Tax=Salinimicrobium sediminis TaxID=1343891 RepID=A0A285X393_9FLAO|nr:hypothetical protein [Salinimicrobium sediminis]SOC79831.1 hypothetical protein SAMN06296241_1368 [Salinimicrobium sediminis]
MELNPLELIALITSIYCIGYGIGYLNGKIVDKLLGEDESPEKEKNE